MGRYLASDGKQTPKKIISAIELYSRKYSNTLTPEYDTMMEYDTNYRHNVIHRTSKRDKRPVKIRSVAPRIEMPQIASAPQRRVIARPPWFKPPRIR